MYVFVIVFLLIFVIMIGATFLQWLSDFIMELKYLDCEIKRTTGKEQRYWIRQKRKLWLSLLPFVKYP